MNITEKLRLAAIGAYSLTEEDAGDICDLISDMRGDIEDLEKRPEQDDIEALEERIAKAVRVLEGCR